jgi:hypothetical protein
MRNVTITPKLITAIDRTWGAIQQRHPDVPGIVIALGAGSRQGGTLKLGSFASGRWQHGDETLAEMFIGGEGLAGGPLEALGTLLHEAGHGVACTRGIKDTSRQGRFHNTRYRAIAEELGLAVAKSAAGGWTVTSVPAATAALYQAELRRLAAALVAYRHPEGTGGRGNRASSNNGLAARCGCDRRIRVSETVLAAGPITCGLCGTDFETR